MFGLLPSTRNSLLPPRLPGRILAGWILASAAVAAQAASPSCAPGHRELFDFQAGDIFQYRLYQRNELAKTVASESVRKYKVLSRRDSGSVRIYALAGRQERITTVDGAFFERAVADYSETRVHADSAGHPLNGCAGDTVAWPGDATLRTLLQAREGDTSWFRLARPGLRMKRLGGKLWLAAGSGSAPVEIMETNTYAEGLGLIDAYFATQSASAWSETLVGYVKNGDTVGVVSPDSRFSEVAALAPPARRPAGSGPGWGSRKGGPRFDARGRRQPAGRVPLPYRNARTKAGEIPTTESEGMAFSLK